MGVEVNGELNNVLVKIGVICDTFFFFFVVKLHNHPLGFGSFAN